MLGYLLTLSLGIYLGYTVHSSETYILNENVKETKYIRQIGRYNVGWSLQHHMKHHSYILALNFYTDKHEKDMEQKDYSFFGFPFKL